MVDIKSMSAEELKQLLADAQQEKKSRVSARKAARIAKRKELASHRTERITAYETKLAALKLRAQRLEARIKLLRGDDTPAVATA